MLTTNRFGDKINLSVKIGGENGMQEKLIILLKQKDLTQHWLANLLDISDKQVGKKIMGDVKFNGDEMFKIADYFKLKVDDIFLPTTHQNGDISNQESEG